MAYIADKSETTWGEAARGLVTKRPNPDRHDLRYKIDPGFDSPAERTAAKLLSYRFREGGADGTVLVRLQKDGDSHVATAWIDPLSISDRAYDSCGYALRVTADELFAVKPASPLIIPGIHHRSWLPVNAEHFNSRLHRVLSDGSDILRKAFPGQLAAARPVTTVRETGTRIDTNVFKLFPQG